MVCFNIKGCPNIYIEGFALKLKDYFYIRDCFLLQNEENDEHEFSRAHIIN